MPNGLTYRLPTDEEWSLAVGLPPEQGSSPQDKSGKNKTHYPWGLGFPPPNENGGNYKDSVYEARFPNEPGIKGYTDGSITTAPVGSFPPNQYGIFDLGGNVKEWCEDWYNNSKTQRVLRGQAYWNGPSNELLSSFRKPGEATSRHVTIGFRVVLEVADKKNGAFTDLFNGKDLTGFRGGGTFDSRKLAALPVTERSAQIAKWTASMRQHWRVENGELVNDGKGDYATTEREFGDFELLLEYKTVPGADSGIYLRGYPQVQIWDFTGAVAKFGQEAIKGSGGLWNNSPGAPGRDPLVKADKPFGEWNKLRIMMTGARVSVWLNAQLVVDQAVLENYFDRGTPIAARGPIQFQTFNGEIRFRNLRIREFTAAGGGFPTR